MMKMIKKIRRQMMTRLTPATFSRVWSIAGKKCRRGAATLLTCTVHVFAQLIIHRLLRIIDAIRVIGAMGTPPMSRTAMMMMVASSQIMATQEMPGGIRMTTMMMMMSLTEGAILSPLKSSTVG